MCKVVVAFLVAGWGVAAFEEDFIGAEGLVGGGFRGVELSFGGYETPLGYSAFKISAGFWRI
jgi:hypothetical protein